MARQSSSLATLAAACLLMAGMRSAFVGSFRAMRALRVARAYDSGKVNLGLELDADVPPPPQPVLDCDQGCMVAIYDCLEEGCSVDALLKLDQKLAEDEKKVQATVSEIREQQKTTLDNAENKGTLAWLNNFLSRSGSLRAQLHSLKSVEDTDFVQQMVRAASVAFGGGRVGDYPKVGVSPYSQ